MKVRVWLNIKASTLWIYAPSTNMVWAEIEFMGVPGCTFKAWDPNPKLFIDLGVL